MQIGSRCVSKIEQKVKLAFHDVPQVITLRHVAWDTQFTNVASEIMSR